jgi:hypothetical protein
MACLDGLLKLTGLPMSKPGAFLMDDIFTYCIMTCSNTITQRGVTKLEFLGARI